MLEQDLTLSERASGPSVVTVQDACNVSDNGVPEKVRMEYAVVRLAVINAFTGSGLASRRAKQFGIDI
jgi:hypothetical protein